jgi:hypothetical protein
LGKGIEVGVVGGTYGTLGNMHGKLLSDIHSRKSLVVVELVLVVVVVERWLQERPSQCLQVTKISGRLNRSWTGSSLPLGMNPDYPLSRINGDIQSSRSEGQSPVPEQHEWEHRACFMSYQTSIDMADSRTGVQGG